MLDSTAAEGVGAEDSAPMRRAVVVGLGNPGLRYQNTPHNLGFMVVDELAKRNGIAIRKNEGLAQTGCGSLGGATVLLAKPQSFMNNTGPGLRAFLRAHQLTTRELVLVHDELDLPWSALRIRRKGSAAGHNGVKSVIGALGTDFFTRVRVGIRPDGEIGDAAEYVLAPIRASHKESLEEMVSFTAEAVESIIAEGVLKAMAKYNRRARGLSEEEG